MAGACLTIFSPSSSGNPVTAMELSKHINRVALARPDGAVASPMTSVDDLLAEIA